MQAKPTGSFLSSAPFDGTELSRSSLARAPKRSAHFQDLPETLVSDIAGNLQGDDLNQFALSSKQLRNARRIQTSKIDVDSPDLEHALLRFPYVSVIKLNGVVEEIHLAMLRHNAHHLRFLDLSHTTLQGEHLRQLASIAPLRMLDLSAVSGLDDKAIESISQLTRLKYLYLDQEVAHPASFSDDMLAKLGQLTELRELSLANCTQFTGKSFTHWRGLENLRSLVLDGGDVRVDQLAFLQPLENLSHLGLSNLAEFTTENASELARFKALKKLDLCGVSINDEALAELGKLAELESLDLEGASNFEGHCFTHWSSLTRLSSLNLNSAQDLAPESVRLLGQLHSLRELNLSNQDQMTGLQCAAWSDLRSLSRLTLRGCVSLENEALAHLARLPNLSALYLSNCPRLDVGCLPHLQAMIALKELTLLSAHPDLVEQVKHTLVRPNLKIVSFN
jgi:hypothetical protein